MCIDLPDGSESIAIILFVCILNITKG